MTDALAVAMVAILDRIEDRLDDLVVCEACGCLCRPSEICPACHPGRGGLDD